MKKILLAVFALALVFPASAMTGPRDETGFMRTSRKYNENDNYEKACRDEFGRHARVADWRDVKEYSRRHPGMEQFIRDTGLSVKPLSALIYNRGEKWGPRHEAFIIQMRNHKPSRRGQGVVDDIGGRLFELKVRNNNAKPVLCYRDPDRVEFHGGPHPEVLPPRPDHHPDMTPPHHRASIRSTTRAYREFAYLNQKCQKEFGPNARVADWSDIKRMVDTRHEYEEFIRVNELSGSSAERLMYFNGQYKTPRDKHFYLLYNPTAKTPHGVTPIDRLRNNKLNAAAIMHIRARVLCFVP